MKDEEELALVHRAVDKEMAELDASKVKVHSFEEIRKILEPEN